MIKNLSTGKLYLIIAGVVVTFLVAVILINKYPTDSGKPAAGPVSGEQMPEDDVHKGLGQGGGAPDASNVSEAFKKQMQELQSAVQANPNDTTKLRELAEFLFMSHKPQEAIETYQRILKINPNRKDVYLELAYIYFQEQNFAKAEESTNMMLQIDPKDLNARYNLGAIAAAKGEKDKARKIWESLIKNNPGTDAASRAAEYLKKL